MTPGYFQSCRKQRGTRTRWFVGYRCQWEL